MYLIASTTVKSDMTVERPFGPKFSEKLAGEATVMLIYGSSFKEPGKDYCRFVLRDRQGNDMAVRQIEGY